MNAQTFQAIGEARGIDSEGGARTWSFVCTGWEQ